MIGTNPELTDRLDTVYYILGDLRPIVSHVIFIVETVMGFISPFPMILFE